MSEEQQQQQQEDPSSTQSPRCSTPISRRSRTESVFSSGSSGQASESILEDSIGRHNSGGNVDVSADGEDEEEDHVAQEEAAAKMREVARKVLRYQNSRSSLSSVSGSADVPLDAQRSPGSGCGTLPASPRQRTVLDEPETSQQQQVDGDREAVGSLPAATATAGQGDGEGHPKVILRPHQRFLQSKANGIVRRHTLTLPTLTKAEDSDDDDDIWIPTTEVKRPRAPPLGLLGKIKSAHLFCADAANSSFECVDTPVKDPPARPSVKESGEGEGDKPVSVPSLNFNLMQGSLVQRRSAAGSSSGFMAFFKRLSERAKPV